MAYEEFEQDSSKLLLRAVNVLLETIGEPPLEGEDNYDDLIESRQALDAIQEAKREIRSDMWDFNTDTDYILAPDLTGKIIIPFNVLEVMSDDGDLINRGWRLYSKSNQSDRFEEPQTVTIVWDLPYNDLSHSIRHYITITAARRFQGRQVSDKLVYGFTQQDELNARLIARKNNTRSYRPNSSNSRYNQNYLVSGTI